MFRNDERKDTRWGFAFITLYNREAIEEKIKKMAAKGWLIEEMQNRIIWNYRRIEPRELSFALVYSGLTHENDPASIEKQKERDELYAADGWIPAADWDTLRVYYNEQPDPVPIETDPVVQAESIFNAMKLQWNYYIFLAALSVFQLGKAIWAEVEGFLQAYSGWVFIFMILITLYTIFFAFNEIFSDVRWHKKALQAAEHGYLLPLKRSKLPFILLVILMVLLVLTTFL